MFGMGTMGMKNDIFSTQLESPFVEVLRNFAFWRLFFCTIRHQAGNSLRTRVFETSSRFFFPVETRRRVETTARAHQRFDG